MVVVFPAWHEREEQGREIAAAAVGAFTTSGAAKASSQSTALYAQWFVPFSRALLLN